ncbi:MAG: hypothetical protein KDD03_11585, partial [Gelidibacter sp.]|nr:hypothetical protein [Gelidibacter sp.]
KFYNIPETLTEQGEFFYDFDNRKMQYIPKTGEYQGGVEIYVPVSRRLIDIAGTDLNSKVENLHFDLTFKHTYSAVNTSNRYNPVFTHWAQSDNTNVTGGTKGTDFDDTFIDPEYYYMQELIRMNYTDSIDFTGSEFMETGEKGVNLVRGVTNTNFTKCWFRDIGAFPLDIGEMTTYWIGDQPETADTHHTTVHNCIFHTVGQNFEDSFIVMIRESGDNTITHNYFADGYNQGINVGQEWSYSPTHSHNNIVDYNRFQYLGHGRMDDFSAIHNLGESIGSRCNNNIISHIWGSGDQTYGLYTDEGVGYIECKNNLVYGLKASCYNNHFSIGNSIKNNIFINSHEYMLSSANKPTDNNDIQFNLENNIIMVKSTITSSDTWAAVDSVSDYNIYYHTEGGTPTWNGGYDLAGWQTYSGKDANSIVANPGTWDEETETFTPNTAVTDLIGFVMFDTSQCGVLQDDPEWVAKAVLDPDRVQAYWDGVNYDLSHVITP